MIINKLKKSIRWDGWAQGKIPWLCSIISYLIIKNYLYTKFAVADFILFICFSIISCIYGYLVNDLFDIQIDRKHGKPNAFGCLGEKKGTMIVLFTLTLSVLLGLRFILKPYFTFFWITWLFLATFYSAKPLRFKEKGAVGLICAFTSQYPIPIILSFCVFGNLNAADMWEIVSCAAISGAALEIGHQRFDLEKDSKTNTTTFAVKTGKEKVDLLYRFFIILDLLSVLAVLMIMAFNAGFNMFTLKTNIFIIPILIYSALTFIILRNIFQAKFQLTDPYYVEGRQDIFNITYTLFPNFFLPFYLGLLLVIKSFTMLPILLVFILITYINFPKANFFWPFLKIWEEINKLFRK
jgi:4-hydroxybenzoate polyprenyltransferase